MGKTLRVLNIEDSERDSALLLRYLKNAGYDVVAERVDTAADMSAALEAKPWDILLCDYSMPRFSALAALNLLNKMGLDIPFIIISGTVGEEIAVEAMLTGAHDYLSKDNFTRLVPAIERELHQAEIRREKRKADEERRKSDDRYRALFDSSPDGIIVSGPNNFYLDANASMCRMLGYTHQELVGMHAADIVGLSEAGDLDEEFEKVKTSGSYSREWRFRRKDRSQFTGDVIATIMPDGNLLAMIRDITDRKRTEKALSATAREKAESLALIDTILANAPVGFAFHDRELNYIRINETLAAINGLSVNEHLGRNINEVLPKMAPLLEPILRMVTQTGKPVVDFELSGETRSEPGKKKDWLVSFYPVRMAGGAVLGVGVLVAEVTARREADRALRESEERYRDLVENAIDVIYTLDLNGNYTSMNKAGERLSGYPRELSLSRNIADSIVPEYREKALQMIAAQIEGKDISAFEIEIMTREGARVALEVNTRAIEENGITVGVQGIARDITERKRMEAELVQSEIRYRSLFENMLEGYAYCRLVFNGEESARDFIYLEVNEAFEQLTGLRDVIGRNVSGLVPGIFVNDPDIFEVYNRVAATGKPERFETNFRSLNRWLSITVYSHQAGHFVAIFDDITERKTVEERLTTERNLLVTVIDNLPDYVFVKDTESRFIMDNIAHREHLGMHLPEDIAGKTDFDFFSKEIADPFFADEAKIIKTGEVMIEREEPGVDLAGNPRWLLTTKVPLRDPQGDVTGIVGINRDITERKLADEALRRQQTELRVLFDLMPALVWFKDTKNRILRVNKRVADAAGKTIEEIEGKLVGEVYPAHADMFYEADLKVMKSGTPDLGIVEMIHDPDGKEIWGQTDRVPVFDKNEEIVGIVVMAQDITERKLAETVLRESNEKFNQLADNISDVFWIRSADMKEIYYISPAFEKVWGYPVESVYENPLQWLDFIFPDDREAAAAAYETLMNSSPTMDVEYRIVRNGGEIRWVRVRGFQVRDAAGKVIRLAGIVSDVTERKVATTLLSESRQSLKLAADAAKLGIWDWDVVGNRLVWDEKMYELYGIRSEDFSGAYDAWQKGLHPDDREFGDAAIQDALAGVRDFHTEFRVVWPNGVVRHLEAYADVKRSEDGTPIRMIGVNWDVTERKHLEDEYRQSHKMEAVGLLAGGIAHDFNNLLTAINGYSDLTLRKMSTNDPLRRNIEEVKKAGDRAAELTNQLLAFSRKQVLKPIVHSLNSVILNIENMLARIIKKDVELRTVLQSDLGNIKADPGQVEQVIMNLAINARDAMPGGGTLTIETQNVYLDENYVSQHLTVARGPFVKLVVTDTGAGMNQVTQKRMFEPFFTTKDVGKGTGLGLSTVYGIVKQSGGDIMVYSEVGIGTTFKIYFPSVSENVEIPKWIGEGSKDNSGTETVLLVEDEEIVRVLVREILTSSGYQVLEAASGDEALAICKTSSKPIHLLLTDVIMPKMSGPSLSEQVVKLLPAIKVLLMSGYTDDSMGASGILSGETPFIEKPFTPDALAWKIREVLGRPEPVPVADPIAELILK